MKSDLVDADIAKALVVRERSSVLLMPVMNVAQALERLEEFQKFCREYLQESRDGGQDGGDYGVIPGTKKKTLLKSGAEKLCEIYGLADEYVMLREIENWESGLFAYTVKCVLKSRRDDSLVGEGLGSCSSYESKYRWREQERSCPTCGKATIIKGKEQYGGGWLCWAKRGGCGAKFTANDPAMVNQIVGRTENPDIIDTVNTILKMAKKRAKIDAVIGVTRSSGIFTQDLEEVPSHPVVEPGSEASVKPKGKAPQNSPAVQTPEPTDTDPEAPISEGAAAKLWAVARRQGWTKAALQEWLRDLWNYDSLRTVRQRHYDGILEQLNTGTPQESHVD